MYISKQRKLVFFFGNFITETCRYNMINKNNILIRHDLNSIPYNVGHDIFSIELSDFNLYFSRIEKVWDIF